MSLNVKAMAGYLMGKGLDKATATRVAADRSEGSWNGSFLEAVEENRPLIGRKEAMHLAACSMLYVKGMPDYPVDRVQALVAVLAADAAPYTSLEAILGNANYFEKEAIVRLVGDPDVQKRLAAQYDKSIKKRGFFGLFV